MSRSITSLVGYFRKIGQVLPEDGEMTFYRGHSNRAAFKMLPSLFRNEGWKENEQLLVNELLSSNPSDFKDDHSMFEKLVRMQHHFLPTRLLDVTSNPLMALYFACCDSFDTTAEVIIVQVKKQVVKYSDSDTVSCIANLARLTSHERSLVDTTLDSDDFNKRPTVGRLLHFIKEEKPYFTACINPGDLNSIQCVRPKMSNLRISSQNGAFLLFGINAILPEEGNDPYKIARVVINGKSKEKICKELETLNIHRGTVYPNIENSSIVIKKRYENSGA